jgi:hypothetical protein
LIRTLLVLAATLTMASVGHAETPYVDRLSVDELSVLSPSARVAGAPGAMRIVNAACRDLAADDLRRRVVNIAIQEWGFFGFRMVDLTVDEPRRRWWRGPLSSLGREEAERVANSIAGYWAITSRGDWIIDRQNAVWQGPWGVGADWRDPWSAAFVSWVMCESGLGESGRFRRAIAHYEYIDQAIEARDDDASRSAFVAYDVGETAIEPGDLLCSVRRSAYRSIEQRRRHLGKGIRTHCDIVVKVEAPHDQILAIGGNVRDAVSLKVLPAVFRRGSARSIGREGRRVFAHLKLRAGSIEADAFENSPTVRALLEQASRAGRRGD